MITADYPLTSGSVLAIVPPASEPPPLALNGILCPRWKHDEIMDGWQTDRRILPRWIHAGFRSTRTDALAEPAVPARPFIQEGLRARDAGWYDGRLHDLNARFQMIQTRLFDAWVGTIAHRLLNLIPPQFQLSMRPQGVGCGHRLFRQEAAGSRTGGR